MKKTIFCILISLLLSISTQAQVKLDKVVKSTQKKTEKKVENRIERRIDKGIDKSLDAVEDGIDDAVKGDGEKKNESGSTATEKKSSGPKPASEKNTETQSGTQPVSEKPSDGPKLEWAKYDFVPGTEIIFEDNQEGEQNGEFPSKWDLTKGTIENAAFGGESVIMFRKCNANGIDGIVPLLKNPNQDYLSEEFTIEFDAYFERPDHSYRIYLFDLKNQPNLTKENNTSNRRYLRFSQNSADGKDIQESFYPGFSNANTASNPGWRHIAISFNVRALKVYLDDARVLNIPNLGYNPTGFTLGFHNPSGNYNGFVKNVRIAKGAVPLYDKFLTDGKFVTTGIKFDVNKSAIKPESMGTINYVVKMMQEHPELKFSVEGHTDSDGDENSNLKLSEARAQAVVAQMVKAGIDKSRLTGKGLGESKPVAGNDTSEGKAMNRRVEFVKF